MILSAVIVLVALVVVVAVVVIVGEQLPSPVVPPHRATTAHLQAIYPFQSPDGFGGRGVYIGTEYHGGSFCFDPFELYAQGKLTNPNMVIAGQVGKAKSSLVKTMMWRHWALGRPTVVIDPKGEFGPLAEAMGGTVLRLEPGSHVRLNPLDPGPRSAGLTSDEVRRRREGVVGSLAEASLGRPLLPEERTALGLALSHVGRCHSEPTLVDLVGVMLAPPDELATEVHTTTDELRARSRDAALELRRLCQGDLRGMFDGRTNVEVDWDGPIVVIDLSQLLDATETARAIVMACTVTWLHAVLSQPSGRQRLMVLDEAWALLSSAAIARWLRALFKLSRNYGLSNVIVVHRFSDLEAAGGGESEVTRLAKGLLSDTETRVVYAQAQDQLAATARLLGLSRVEAELLPSLPRGCALWKVNQSSFIVQHVRSELEVRLTDTDDAMRGDVAPQAGHDAAPPQAGALSGNGRSPGVDR